MNIRKHKEGDYPTCECGNPPVATIEGGINCHSCGNEIVACEDCLTAFGLRMGMFLMGLPL